MAGATESSPRKKQRAADDDRISHLPDVLLIQILSLLSTKEAILTAVLSKKWRPIWRALPFLDFDDETCFDESESSAPYGGLVELGSLIRTGFREFVYSVLLQHDGSSIKRFTLRCASPNSSEGDIANWVSHVARRMVEHVELNLSIARYVALPRCLFNCSTITVMKLNGVFLNVIGSFSVSLPLLKVLHIGDRVLYGSHDYVVKLLAGCPLLEDLVLESSFNDACSGQVCSNENFHINLNKLLRARIGFSWKEKCQKYMFLLFQALCHVNWLSLSSPTVACMKSASESDIPVFDNLIQLEISFVDYYWNLLINLLKRSHKLEAITIHKESSKYGRQLEPEWNRPTFVPECLLVHLKTFCLRECQGLETELNFLEYIIQHARVLETLTIYLSSSLSSKQKLEIRRRLSLTQWKFGTCQIVFH